MRAAISLTGERRPGSVRLFDCSICSCCSRALLVDHCRRMRCGERSAASTPREERDRRRRRGRNRALLVALLALAALFYIITLVQDGTKRMMAATTILSRAVSGPMRTRTLTFTRHGDATTMAAA